MTQTCAERILTLLSEAPKITARDITLRLGDVKLTNVYRRLTLLAKMKLVEPCGTQPNRYHPQQLWQRNLRGVVNGR